MTAWLENVLSQGMIERLGWTLVYFLWQATVVALLLAASLRLLRRSNANVRYLTACSALVLMVVAPVATIWFVEVPGLSAEAGRLPAAPFAVTPSAAMQVVEEMPSFSQTPDSLQNANPAAVVPWSERIASMLEPGLPYVVLGWLAGVFGLSAWHLGGWMQLQRLKRRMVHGVGASLQQQMMALSGRLGVHRVVTLLESAIVEVPTVVGWLRPVILLPASALTGLSPEQLEAILAHELAHIRRYDYLANVLQTVVEILGFYHPAIWWVSRRIRNERENCCDDMAVRLCGDSVRYARALTCLEEIRHSRGELALAATGGSLLDRIARLVGRPAIDDRRFDWLCGLIALLLVACITIPAALALAAPSRRLPEFAADTNDALTDDAWDRTEPNEPSRARVLLDFTLAEVFSDAILDHDTAMQVVDLLARLPARNARGTAAPGPPPSIEELRKPLADVFAKFGPRPGKSKNLVDRLVSKGYAEVMFSPRLEVFAGQQAAIATGDMPDPNALAPGGGKSAYMRMTITPHEVQDTNATKLDIDLARAYPNYKSGDPNQQTTTSIINSTLVVPNNQYVSITDPGVKRVDENGRERLSLLLVRSAVAHEPEASPPRMAGEPSPPEPNVPAVSLRTETAGEPNAAAKRTRVLIKVRIIDAADSTQLDRQTLMQVENILGKRVRPEGRAGESRRLRLPLGEVLRNHVVLQSLPDEMVQALVELLKSKGYLTVSSSPEVVAFDGKRARVSVVKDEYFWMGPPAEGSPGTSDLQKVTAGTRLEVTPRVNDPNSIFMDMKVEVSDIVSPAKDGAPPVISRRTIAASVTTLGGHCVTLGGLVENASARTKDSMSVYVMATLSIWKPPDANQAPQQVETRHIRVNYIEAERAISLLPSALQPYVTPMPGKQQLIITAPEALADRIVADIRAMDIRPRNVLFNARVVTMESRDLQDLGIDWGLPRPRRTGAFGPAPEDANDVNDPSVTGIQTGTVLDRASAASLRAGLDALRADHRLQVIVAPMFCGQDGHESRLPVLPADGRLPGRSSTDLWTVLPITPLVGDNNDITIEIAAPVTDYSFSRRNNDTPIAGANPMYSITIQDGGTIVLAGLTPDLLKEKAKRGSQPGNSPFTGLLHRNTSREKPRRETVLFLTASSVPQPAHTQAAHP